MAHRCEPSAAEKLRATVHAKAALLGIWGIHVEPSHDDRGQRTVIVTAGTFTREVPVQQLDEALAEIKAYRGEACAA